MQSRIPFIVLAGLASACGSEDGTGNLTDRPVPVLVARPSAAAFGRVPVGAAARLAVELSNEGRADAPLALAAGSGPTCDAVSAADEHCLDLSLGPLAVDGTLAGTVYYFPRSAAPPTETTWTIECGAGCGVTLSSRGSGVDQAVMAPEMLDFGRLHPGCEAEQGFEIGSVVDVPFEVRSVRVEADFDDVYTLDLSRALPTAVRAGEPLTVDMKFTARDGDVPANLYFEVAAEDFGFGEGFTREVRVEIIGRGDLADPPCN